MALKTKLEDQDHESQYVDIPLFATVEEAIKDVTIDEQTHIQIKIQKKENLE